MRSPIRNLGSRNCPLSPHHLHLNHLRKQNNRFLSTQSTPTEKPPTPPSTPVNAHTYITTLLRNNDYENYLASLFVPARSRDAVWAVRAFNVETALIRESVRDAALGKGRIQWWRDAVDDVFAVSGTVSFWGGMSLESAP